MATSTTLSLALHHVAESYSGGDSYTGTVIKSKAQQQSSNLHAQGGGASFENTTNTLSSLPRSPTGPSASPPHSHQPQQSVKHGLGRYDFADGSFYEGEWSHGSMSGKGVYFEASTGDKFDGIWKEGRRVQGVYRYGENGNMYIGGFDLETGSKKTGPALVLDQCVLYKALYAEDRLIKRDMVLMPAHKDWTTLAGGLTAAHNNNPNKYTDPDHSLIYRTKHPYTSSAASAAVKRTASSSSNAPLLSPHGEKSPQRNPAYAVTSQAAAAPNSVTTPSPAAYRRAMSPTAYSRTATAMSSFNGSSATPRPQVHNSGTNYHHQASIRTNRSPSPTAGTPRVMNSYSGASGTPRREKVTIVKASYRAPHVVITSMNRADASGLGRVSVLAAAAADKSAASISIAESQKRPSIAISGLHDPTGTLYGGVGSPNRMRQVISQNSGRNFGAGPVTVGVAPKLKTTERCASPSRQEAFASLCEAVKSQPRHDDLNASIVPGGVSSGQYSNNTYYEDVTRPDHPLGLKLMSTVHAEGERDKRRREDEDTMTDPMLFAEVSVSRNTSVEPSVSVGYSTSRRKDSEEDEGGERGDLSAKAIREVVGEGGPYHLEGARAEREGEDVTISSEDDDDEETRREAEGKLSKKSKENESADGRRDGAPTNISSSGDAQLTPQEALATAKAVLRQRRTQIEEDQLVNKKLSMIHHNASSSSAFASFRREQSSSSHQSRLRDASVAHEDRNHVHPRPHAAPSLLETTPTGYGSSLYNNTQPQEGGAVSSTMMAAYSPMPSRGVGNGTVVLVDHNASSAPLGSGGGSALLMAPPARTKNGAVILPPPNPRSSTCRSLSNSAFGNIQRGRVEHVDDVSKIELEQAYRYFNYNKGA